MGRGRRGVVKVAKFRYVRTVWKSGRGTLVVSLPYLCKQRGWKAGDRVIVEYDVDRDRVIVRREKYEKRRKKRD